MERNVDQNIYEKLSAKYGMSISQAKASVDNMVQMAKDAGLDFHMDTLVLTNTFDAHRVTMLAKTKGLMKEMTESLLKAHFTDSKHIGDWETLVELAEEVGLDPKEVNDMLLSDNMSKEVLADKEEAARLRINSVPFFLVNKKYAVTGAQATDVFVETIKKIMEEDNDVSTTNGMDCNDEGCDLPPINRKRLL